MTLVLSVLIWSLAWWALIGPAAITFLILYVAGVPMLEKKMTADPKYADYLNTTCRF